MFDLQQLGIGRQADRDRIHHIGESVPDVTGFGEASVAYPRVRSEERGAFHAWNSRANREARSRKGLQNIRENDPFLAGRQGEQSAAGAAADNDGVDERRAALRKPGRGCREEVWD